MAGRPSGPERIAQCLGGVPTRLQAKIEDRTGEINLERKRGGGGRKTECGGGRLGGRAATGSAVKLQQRGQRRRADQGYRSNPRGGKSPFSLSCMRRSHYDFLLKFSSSFSLLLFPYIGERKREGCPGGIPVNKGCFGPK